MFKCVECGAIFEEPRVVREKGEAWGATYYHTYSACPYCYGAYDEYSEEDEYEEDDEEEC